MTARSKVSRLPPAIRDRIAELHHQGLTIDAILAELKQLDLPPGALPNRANLRTHINYLDLVAERVQHSRAIAEVLVSRLGDAPESRHARFNIELMHGIISDIALAQTKKEEEEANLVAFTPAEAHLLARTLELVTRAQRNDQEQTFKLRKEIAAEQNRRVEAAAADVAKVAQEEGLSAERIAMIQAKIAGLRIEPGMMDQESDSAGKDGDG